MKKSDVITFVLGSLATAAWVFGGWMLFTTVKSTPSLAIDYGKIRAKVKGKVSDKATVTQVERAWYRIELPHDDCPSNGYWVAISGPRPISVADRTATMTLHKCDGCGDEQEFFNQRYPRVTTEWVPVEE